MIPYRMNPLGISVNEDIPLTLTALSAGSTVTLNATGSPTVSGLHYRRGKSGTWLAYTIGDTITLDNTGDSVQFWNSASTLSTGSGNYVQFAITDPVSAAGTTHSLLNWSGMSNYCFWKLFLDCIGLLHAPELPPGDTVPNYALESIFNGCSGMLTAPKLPYTALGTESMYQAFYGCTSLQKFPLIRATSLANNSLGYAFRGCTAAISEQDVLPATTLAQNCYQGMYWGTTIAELPKLPASTLAAVCYRWMARDCLSLNRIEVNFTSWPSDSTYEWVRGAGSSGTFVKPSSLPEEYGNSRIPTGWTVVDK